MTSKIKTKQLSWLVATLMLVAAMVMPSTACAESSITPSKPTTGDGSAVSPYQIGTAAELYWFAQEVNGGNAGINAVLTANITVNSGVLKADGSIADDVSGFRSWTPIGYYDSANKVGYPYSGTFDGNNHTISGLYFNDSSINNVGLFGYSCGTIQNVGVVDSYFNGDANIGGVCGQNNGGTIQSCHNSSTIYGTNNAGGVCGINNAEVISASSSTATIINCYNTGSVSVNGTGKFYPFIECGGVCGYNSAFVRESGTAIAIIKNCFNTGSVSGTGGDYDNYVGGVCGNNYCFTNLAGSVTASITNCYNNSDIYSGSIVGYIDGGTVVENVEGKTTAQFKSGEVCYLLNGSTSTGDPLTWYQNLSAEDGDAYPVLTNTGMNTVYYGYEHGSADPIYTNSAHAHAYAPSAADEANGNHDKSYQGDFNWADNDDKTNATVTATFTCEVCRKVVSTKALTVENDDSKANTKANCTEKGYNYYKTSYSFAGETFPSTYTQTLDALGHDYSGTASINIEKHIYEKNCKRCSVFLEYCATSDGKVKANEDPEGGFTANDLTLQDATVYDNQAVFTATNFTFTRTFSNANWTTWYVPFDLTLTEEICAHYDFSRINNVHQYDTDNDGTADKTVVESFRQIPGVTLKANYPYLVKPVSEGDLNMVLPLEGVKPALAMTNSIDCQSVDFSYTFTGTYTGMGEGGSNYYDPYTLWTDGTWQHFRSLDPMRHYLTVTPRNSSFASAASLRSIMLSVIGDEGTTGIVNMYSDERKAAETYDLGGRRLPAGASQKGVMIENGKVIIKK